MIRTQINLINHLGKLKKYLLSLIVLFLFFPLYSCREYPSSYAFDMKTQEMLFNLQIDMREHPNNKSKKKKYNIRL